MHCESSVRNELLDLLPVAANRFGLKRRALEHLIWLLRHTRVMDWEPGNRAVVYKSVSDTAAERQVSVRQIYNYEQEIAAALELTVEVSYNRRRYGRRDPETGRIVAAFGFELTNLRRALPILRETKAEIDAENDRRRTLKQRLSAIRGQVRKLTDAVIAQGDVEQIDAAGDRRVHQGAHKRGKEPQRTGDANHRRRSRSARSGGTVIEREKLWKRRENFRHVGRELPTHRSYN